MSCACYTIDDVRSDISIIHDVVDRALADLLEVPRSNMPAETRSTVNCATSMLWLVNDRLKLLGERIDRDLSPPHVVAVSVPLT